MKPQLAGTIKRPSGTKPAGAEAALSRQEALVAAIHGAFEVAVESAVQEVTKLFGQATADVYEEVRQENESLKERLQRAEALLDSARKEETVGSSPRSKQLLDTSKYTDQPTRPKRSQNSPNPKVRNAQAFGLRCGVPAAQAHDPQRKPMNRNKKQSGGDVSDQEKNNGGVVACDALVKDICEEMPRVCVVRVENLNQPCQEHDLAQLPSADDETTLQQITVKQEKPEEEGGGSACCLDSIKVEDLSHECMLAVQTKMLEEWKPEALDSVTPVSCSGLAQDLPSLSSEFPNIFQLAEPAPVPAAPPQVYGVHVRTSRNLSHTYACKYCGQMFHLPSLLRRHHGQCQQKLQQGCQRPVAGNRRTKLQLYPPGCSPFCCTVCNREFNRMENLKTHLRIHTGERPFTCSVCSKCFRHSGALTRHFRIHTGEKPYICGQCGKSFRNCGGLKFHERSHNKLLQ
uniref:zinc finger protein 62-like isoform X2 n=1 Tax=Scatophagus argus TaxID=75038 RepID=UPI001ED85F11|nr:zinc finger protein 62-like isoform X2 [Scatophagus argus]